MKLAAVLAIALTCGTASAAEAPAGLPPEMQAALAGIRSFQMSSTTLTGVTVRMTVQMPDRVHVLASGGAIAMETITIGDDEYVRMNAGPWTKIPLPKGTAMQLGASMLAGIGRSSVTILPDRTEDGTTVGAFSTTATGAATTASQAPETTCTYDKSTFLTRSCETFLRGASQPMTVTYSHWNDPANVVTAPI